MRTSLVIMVIALTSWTAVATADDEEAKRSDPTTTRLADELTTLFQKHYPKGTNLRKGKSGFEFEYEVTKFEFPYTGPPGKKHETTTHRGPKNGGIMCRVYLEQGEYRGQLALHKSRNGPMEALLDNKVYKRLFMAPYSAKKDVSLWVFLAYPPDTNDDFLKQFRALITDFDKYLD